MSRRRTSPQPSVSIDPGRDAAPGPAGFICTVCGGLVPEEAAGTQNRNHCPHCLSSIHVDVRPGDRRSLCRGSMQAIAVWVDGKGELRLIHRCTECGVLKSNRIAGDDDPDALRDLADQCRAGVTGAVYWDDNAEPCILYVEVPMDERRSSPRVGMRQLVEVGYGREYFLQAAGVNLSESGLLCETAEAPEPGTRVFIMLEVRGDGPRNSDGSPQNIEIEGVVARTEETENGYRVGIEFADIPDEETKHALDTIIDHVQSKSA